MAHLRCACFALFVVLIPLAATAQNSTQVGTLSCDVSRGIGMFVVARTGYTWHQRSTKTVEAKDQQHEQGDYSS